MKLPKDIKGLKRFITKSSIDAQRKLSDIIIKDLRASCGFVEYESDVVKIFRRIAKAFRDVEVYQDIMVINPSDRNRTFVAIKADNITISTNAGIIKINLFYGDPIRKTIRVVKNSGMKIRKRNVYH